MRYIYIFFFSSCSKTERIFTRYSLLSFSESGTEFELVRIFSENPQLRRKKFAHPIWSKGSQREFSIPVFVKRRSYSFFFESRKNSSYDWYWWRKFEFQYNFPQNEQTFRDRGKIESEKKERRTTNLYLSSGMKEAKERQTKGLPPFRKPGEFSSTILNFKLLYSP